MNDSLEQLPASSYTPIEIEQLDRKQIDAWLESISGRLEGVKQQLEARRSSAAAAASQRSEVLRRAQDDRLKKRAEGAE